MADGQHDYKAGPGRPLLHSRFHKRQSGNPGGRSTRKLHALLADALNEPVFVTVESPRGCARIWPEQVAGLLHAKINRRSLYARRSTGT